MSEVRKKEIERSREGVEDPKSADKAERGSPGVFGDDAGGS